MSVTVAHADYDAVSLKQSPLFRQQRAAVSAESVRAAGAAKFCHAAAQTCRTKDDVFSFTLSAEDRDVHLEVHGGM
jgi:hypothetical protein